MVLLSGARGQRQFADRSDRGQGLATKTHGGNRFKVVQIADLAGGVATQGQWHVSGLQTDAIVFHADETNPAFDQTHHHLGSTGVQSVVHQFTHHRRRSFDHFTGGNLADQFIGEFADGASRRGGGVHPWDSKGVPCLSLWGTWL